MKQKVSCGLLIQFFVRKIHRSVTDTLWIEIVLTITIEGKEKATIVITLP
jgi:hypothetical protein